jgi:glycerate kinase
MRVVVAPDKFKGSLSAAEAAQAMAAGIRAVYPQAEIDLCPMADGGEGTVAALVGATGGHFVQRAVTGPLAEMKVNATFGVLGDGKTAVIEMAAASGLALLKPEDRNPLNTTTFGTGELLRYACEMGLKKIILGIGGSATCDAGIGAAQGAGLTVLLRDGSIVSPTEPLAGRDMDQVLMVKHARGSPVDGAEIMVASDVTNPLFGPEGAAVVYGPQKGATPDDVEQLDRMLQSLATRFGKNREANTPGAGAAGGLGFGMMVYFGATLRPGVEIVMDAVGLRQRLQGADWCITGEGRIDSSTLAGKVASGVGRLCREMGVRCAAIGGVVERADGMDNLFDYILQIKEPGMNHEYTIVKAAELLEKQCSRLVL